MLKCKFKIGYVVRRHYSQAAAAFAATSATTVTSNTTSRTQPTYDANRTKLSFAKNLYVGSFEKDIFVRKCKEIDVTQCENCFAINVPKEYGGLELSSASVSEVYKNIGFTNFKNYMAHGNVVKCIDAYGTNDQKKYYLPRLASGECMATFCIHEKKQGYDIGSIQTKASFIDEKWVINGSKQWVINGKRADVFLVLAKTMDECNRPENDEILFSAFLVNKSNNGVKVVSEGEYCNVTFNEVQANCVLEPINNGLLFYTMLFKGDFIESSSATLGELKNIIQNVSQSYNTDNQSSWIKLGKLNSHLYTMECVLDFTNMILDSNDVQNDYETILARLFVNETTYNCLDLLNDLGVSKKSHTYIKNSLLFEGRSNLLSFIGALLGIQHAGQFMANDIRQLRNPLMFPKYTLSHIYRTQRTLKDKPKLNHFIEKYLHPSLKKQAQDLEYCLSKFQFAIQHMFVILGPDTYLFQMILERANSIAMDLFVLASVLHKVSFKLYSSNIQQYPTELIFANLFSNIIREKCRNKVDEILNAPHNVIDPHLKSLGTNCFVEKNYFLEHPLKRNIV